MCGIAGIYSEYPIDDPGRLLRMRDVMTHRGPDDGGVWWTHDKRLGLAHRRLAIIDLSPSGHQPMQDDTGELCIVFNGEIYNFTELREELRKYGHSFRSRGDTEVILASYRQWGVDCLAHFNGMFAFALYDNRKRQLLMARDRAGEKPLFYTLSNGNLRFASELKGLMADPSLSARIDQESMDCYLGMGFIPGDRCILQGVKKLPPAHALLLELDTGRSRLWHYWRLPEQVSSWSLDQRGETDLLNELEILLEDAVRRQLVADVPVGVLLSGGVDSSLVTAMAVRATSKVKTFTIRFPGQGQYDETDHARLIARHFSTDHTELIAAESTVDLLPMLARQFDEPMVDSSMIPTFLVSQMIRQHCTVAVGGDGGDELFAGYRHYSRLLWLQQKVRCIPQWVRVLIANASTSMLPVGFKGNNWLQSLGVDFRQGLPLIAVHYDRRTRQDLMISHPSWPLISERVWEQRIPNASDMLRRAMQMDFENYLPEDILVKVDRSSMLCSLEVRAPLLDYRLIEFAYSKVPSSLRATAAGRKLLLKKLTTRLLPSEFDQTRKQGFSIPLSSWLDSGPWRDLFNDVLLGRGGCLFNKAVVEKMLNGQARGLRNSERLFALVLFELWRREYGVSI